jgi:hypothetical protein
MVMIRILTTTLTKRTRLRQLGVSVKALGHPLNATIEDPRAVTGRLNKAKHVS